MSFFKRAPHADDLDPDDDDPTIDPELRLRTVRTAHSTIAESIRTEARAERRKSLRQKRSRFFRNKSIEKKRPATADSGASEAKPSTEIPGLRRNIYVNTPLTAMEVDSHGEPLTQYVRNKVRTSSKSSPCSPQRARCDPPQNTPSSHFSQRTSTSSSDGASPPPPAPTLLAHPSPASQTSTFSSSSSSKVSPLLPALSAKVRPRRNHPLLPSVLRACPAILRPHDTPP